MFEELILNQPKNLRRTKTKSNRRTVTLTPKSNWNRGLGREGAAATYLYPNTEVLGEDMDCGGGAAFSVVALGGGIAEHRRKGRKCSVRAGEVSQAARGVE